MYTALEKLEKEITGSYDSAQQAMYLQRLDEIEQKALKIKHLRTHSREYYTLRSHIHYVRGCLMQGKPYQT